MDEITVQLTVIPLLAFFYSFSFFEHMDNERESLGARRLPPGVVLLEKNK